MLCPDKTSQCPDGDTCCELNGVSGFGCCPQPQAACCKDGIHCCPHGYACTGSNTCSRGDSIIAAVERRPNVKAKAGFSRRVETVKSPQNVICPDSESQCPSGDTCCKLSSGVYGCCPVPQALCCSDGKHCCPEGYKCDTGAGTCTKGDSILTILEKQPAIKSPQNVMCPDDKSQCSSNTTCCKLTTGEYGCCPQINAVCCSDGKHCCPKGYACNVGSGTCTKGDSILTILEKQPAIKSPQNVMCPDDKSQCSSNATCCKLTTGEYGCCPQINAVCCSDGKHCCPKGYACNVGAGTCTKGDSILTILEKQPAIGAPQKSWCYDYEHYCEDYETCCYTYYGTYGCCDGVNAVCCAEGKSCCPSGHECCADGNSCCQYGYTCGYDKCYKTDGTTVPKLKKQMAFKKQPAVKSPQNNICPDGTSQCASNATCCKLTTGEYGCCPKINAVCCSDGKHCCPQDYSCDLTDGTCVDDNGATLPMYEKIRAVVLDVEPKNVICPDQKSGCADGTTCCQLGSGGYGCCPMANATCCADKKHCCSGGSKCGDGLCIKEDKPLRIEEVMELPPKADDPELYYPCDIHKVYFCLTTQKCCSIGDSKWECCPYHTGVCCDDKKSCCPEHNTCYKGHCKQSNGLTLPSAKRLPAVKMPRQIVQSLLEQPVVKSPQNVICPDQKSQCSSNATCCKLATGEYGCCPKLNAVCCSDGKHCCPEGYDCNVGAGTCTKGDSVLTILEKQPAIQVSYCRCAASQTCCYVSSSYYGCCPSKNAVCCSNGLACCPSGYRCGSDDYCYKSDDATVAKLKKQIAFKKQPAVKSPQNNICPDGTSECSSNATCCKLASGVFGCCPILDAVCCSDGKHCCPKEYTCDTGKGTCTKGDATITILEKQPAIKSPQNNICPDGTSECSSNATCCKLASGVFGCCPQINAVCCSDGKHCCPKGYACNVGAGTCTKGDTTITAFVKEPKVVHSVDNVICPDESSQCPNENTCCKNGINAYNCCPKPEAVCCSDGQHCCPKGYVCNIAGGSCDDVAGGVAVSFLENQVMESAPRRRVGEMEHDLL